MKAIIATSRWRVSVGPISSPTPGRKFATPAGNSTSCRISISLAPMTADCSAGLMMTGQPVTSAAAVMPVRMASGKFHGAMTTATPRGS